MLETIKSLVAHSRKELKIDEGEKPSTQDGTHFLEGQTTNDSSPLNFDEIMSILDEKQEDFMSKETLLEAIASHSPLCKDGLGFSGTSLKDLDASKVQFSRFGASSSVKNRMSNLSLRLTFSYLQAATGLLWSCDPCVPCRGTAPRSASPHLEQVETNNLELYHLSTILVSTISKSLSQTDILSVYWSSPNSSEIVSLLDHFIASLLKIITVDNIYQTKKELSLSLANSILSAFSSSLERELYNYQPFKKYKNTVGSLIGYLNLMDQSVHHFSNLLEDTVNILLSTYSTHSFILDKFSETYSHASHISSNCVLYLGSSLKSALKLGVSLFSDIQHCLKLFSSARKSPSMDCYDFHLSGDTIMHNFSYSIEKSSRTVKALQNYIHHLLQSSCQFFKFNSKGDTINPSLNKQPTHSSNNTNGRKKLPANLFKCNLHTKADRVIGCLKEENITSAKRVDISPSVAFQEKVMEKVRKEKDMGTYGGPDSAQIRNKIIPHKVEGTVTESSPPCKMLYPTLEDVKDTHGPVHLLKVPEGVLQVNIVV